MKTVISFIFVFFLKSSLFSQTGNSVFNDTIMHSLLIETDLPNWFDTLENDFNLNFTKPELYPEIYRKCNVIFDGNVLIDCGFREKGNSSNSLSNFGKKKPLKISFNEFTNQTLDGLKKLNLNNFTNDPSLLHDVISLKLFRDAGVPASRTSYTKVWVNGEYIGLYLVIENVDKTFLKFKYGSTQNDGNLFKTDRGASVPLTWQGSESAAYKDQGLKLTTNETVDNWYSFIGFINQLNYNYTDTFKQYFENKFDIHSYLKILAIEKCIRSWDSYWGGANNFQLYEHPDGKYRWIPWDLNETFQDIKLLSGTDLLTGYLVPTNKFDKRPLLKRIFEIQEYKDEYLNNVCDLIQTNFTLNHLGKFILDRHQLIDTIYKNDPYRYNSHESFKKSLTQTNEDVVSLTRSGYVLRINYPGLYPFINSQRKWAVDQLKGWDYNCSIEQKGVYDLELFPNPADNYVNIYNDENQSFDYASFYLYDFTGKLCRVTKSELLTGKYYTMFLEELSQGFYFVIKKSANGSTGVGKLMVR